MDVLGDKKSSVELVQHMGSDRMIAAAAWISTARDAGTATDAEVERIIRYMLKHNHGTPFEHTALTFRIKAPLFVVQQMLRHRAGVSFNQESGRYVDYDKQRPDFYIPRVFRLDAATEKQGSDGEIANQSPAHSAYLWQCEDAYDTYRRLRKQGVAKEQARGILPSTMYTTLYVTFNTRSLMHFLRLRLDSHAQWEIRKYAEVFAYHFDGTFPITYAAFVGQPHAEGVI